VQVYLNNQLIADFASAGNLSHCAQGTPNPGVTCGSPGSQVQWPITITSAYLNPSGLNVLKIVDQQEGSGPMGFDLEGTVATPEPGSLFLLGTGLFGLAVILFRKAKPSGLVFHN
jgi:hypothetical protein